MSEVQESNGEMRSLGDEAPDIMSSTKERSTELVDEQHRQELLTMFRELRSYAISISEFYKDSGRDVDLSRRRMHSAACRMYEHIDRGIQPGVEYLVNVAYLYDLDQSTRANGYRSFIIVVERCCQRLLALTRYITCHRDSLLFRLDYNSRELDAFVTTLGQLRACLYYLHKLVAFCGCSGGKPGRLFADENDALSAEDKLVAEQMMGEVEMLCQDTFYGRCLGFQFCHSMVRPLSGINLVLASFSHGYKYDSTILQFASSVFSGGKYMMDPDCRGHQVVEATRNGDISFCKAFWSLNENSLLQKVPTLMCPSVRVDHVFHLNPDPFEMMRSDGTDTVTVTAPCANTGPGPISVRLLSREVRQGQDTLMKTSISNAQPPSSGLIIHCHGGGFVAQSSASHEVYLRKWASDCDVPILCVDYSLAPEHKYPRQLEEVFFAYCWAIKNCHLLGSTAKKVCIVGDSAGGTLTVATALRALSYRVRVPDGILAVYGCFLVKYAPSPSRLLSLMDPLLPLGVLSKCLAGLASEQSESSTFPFLPRCDRDVPSSLTAESASDISTCSYPEKTNLDSSGVPDEIFHNSDKIVVPVNSSKQQIYDDSGFVDCPLTSSASLNEPTSSDIVHPSKSDTESSTQKATPSLRDLLKLNLRSPFKQRSPSTGSPNTKRSSSAHVFSTPVESPSAIYSTDDDVLLSPTSPWTNDGAFSTPTYAKMRHFAQSPLQQPSTRAADVVARNPYMSPLLASDDLLADMCPVYLVTCHLDPMLDDSISFAQRLRQLGRTVHCDVLDGLPHGFLNFVLMSPEAKAGSELCIRRLREILFEIPDSNDPK